MSLHPCTHLSGLSGFKNKINKNFGRNSEGIKGGTGHKFVENICMNKLLKIKNDKIIKEEKSIKNKGLGEVGFVRFCFCFCLFLFKL